MSDYLTNLVTRSTERGNLLMPRLPSVFEPVAGDPQPLILESSDETESQRPELRKLNTSTLTPASEPGSFAPVSDERTREAQQSNPAPHEISLSGEIRIPDDRATQRSEQAKTEPEPQREYAAEESAPLSAQSRELTDDSSDIFAEPESLPREQSRYLQIVAKEDSRSEHAHRPPSHPRIKVSRQRRNVERRPNAPLPLPRADRFTEVNSSEPLDIVEYEQSTQLETDNRGRRTGDASIARERELRAALPLDQLLERPASTNPWPASESSSSQTSEPVINVTIGRIEVKATQSSPAEKRTSSRSPVMPLDEYLKLQRRGGSR